MWQKLLIMGVIGLLAVDSALADTGARRRVALVIGNGAYAAQPLPGAVDDARTMAAALRDQGYSVVRHENLSGQRMREALLAFRRKLERGSVGVFYFAGHGMQVGPRVLLLPVDAAMDRPAQVLAQGTDLDLVLSQMTAPRPDQANVVMLDTCLDNPFQAGPASTPPLPPHTIIAYAAMPGQAALDRVGHGLWTAALQRAMQTPGRDIHEALSGAARQVAQDSANRQQPWFASTLTNSLAMATGANAPSPSSLPALAATDAGPFISRGVLPKDSAEQYELTFWESVKDSTHASDYEAYLQAYPNGRFAGLARARIERLRAAAGPKPEAPAPKPAPEKPRPVTPARKPAPETPPAPAAASPIEQPARAPASPATVPKSGADIRDCPACPVLVSVPQGVFTMGSNSSDPSEKPPHRVTIEAPFAIGKTEVTVEQWNACVEAGACPRVAEAARPPNSPARDISWDDAQVYVKWLTKVSGKPYRLPTEAEWEFAARGGSASRYWWGDEMKKGTANCKDCGDPWQADGPAPVASFAANGYGLYDMNGSVWEWVQDCWHSSYKGAPADGRAWEESFCPVRVIRGGSWRDGASYMPVTTRFKYDASVRHSQNGFRAARDLK